MCSKNQTCDFKRGSWIQYNPLAVKHTNTQISRDADSKHLSSCLRDYTVIRLFLVFPSEAACWPQAHSMEKESCRPEVALSSRHWLWQRLGKSALALCVIVMLFLCRVNQDVLAALHFIVEEDTALIWYQVETSRKEAFFSCSILCGCCGLGSSPSWPAQAKDLSYSASLTRI